ncbi:MAG: hypothetical protein ACXWWN_11310 [Gemmatimonadales bacterium]
MPANEATELMLQVRKYNPVPCPNDLRPEFVELLKELGLDGHKAAIVAHECAHATITTFWPATFNRLIREHNRRVALGHKQLPALGLKARACRELLLESIGY